MTSWIVTISNTYPQHWRIAQEQGFWDMTRNAQIRAGDSVYFWLSGSSLLRHTVATSDAAPITEEMRQPWEDSGVRTYTTRFHFRLKDGEPRSQPRWGEIQRDAGIRPGLNTAPVRTDDPTAEAWLAAQFVPVATAVDYSYPSDATQLELEHLLEDTRDRAERTIALRQGQPEFRRDLLAAYGGRCAITGCDVADALEAAHISPYLGHHTNIVPNGLLLRADIHTLFDRYLITIDPNQRVRIAPSLHASQYAALEGAALSCLPDPSSHHPSEASLQAHRASCPWFQAEEGAPSLPHKG